MLKKVFIMLILLVFTMLPVGCVQKSNESSALESKYYSLGYSTKD